MPLVIDPHDLDVAETVALDGRRRGRRRRSAPSPAIAGARPAGRSVTTITALLPWRPRVASRPGAEGVEQQKGGGGRTAALGGSASRPARTGLLVDQPARQVGGRGLRMELHAQVRSVVNAWTPKALRASSGGRRERDPILVQATHGRRG